MRQAEQYEELLLQARRRLANAENRFDVYATFLGANGGRTLEALRQETIEAAADLELLEMRLNKAQAKA